VTKRKPPTCWIPDLGSETRLPVVNRRWAPPLGLGNMDWGCLSVREIEVLSLIVRGHRTLEIAQELGIQASTAKFHIRSILKKTSCRTQAQAAAQFVEWRNGN